MVRFKAPGVGTVAVSKKLSDLPKRKASLRTLVSAARAAERAGRFKEVVENYEEAVKVAPDDANLLNNYAWFLVTVKDKKHRNAERAVELATRAVELTNERNGAILDTLAEALYQTGELEKAAARAAKAAKLDPRPEIRERAERFRKELEEKRSGKTH